MINSFIDRIRKMIPVSAELENDIRKKLVLRRFPKKHMLLRKGEVSNYVYFIQKGILITYYEKDNEEITNWILMENDIAISLPSFYRRIASFEYIQVLQDCELLLLHYVDLMELYANHIEINIVGRKLIEDYYYQSEERAVALRGNATEKYDWLITNFPEIIKRVPSKYIASYLGISEFTLSRIKAHER